MTEINNIILSNLRQAEKEVQKTIPDGYVEIELSTKGKMGAPKCFHIRNFKVRDILALALCTEEELPAKLVSVLNEMIFEDLDVAEFYESEVEELMLYVYLNFYGRKFEHLTFPVDKSDIDYIKNKSNGDEILEDLKEGRWKPEFDLDIVKDINLYDVDDDFNPNITITNKKNGFHCTFGFIKYGDKLTVKKWLDNQFAEEERKFQVVKKKIMHNNSIYLNKGNTQSLYEIDPIEEEDYNEYVNRRLAVLTEVSRLISIVDYNGTDTSKMSLSEKYELMAEDPQIDYGMISKLTKAQEKHPVGIKPNVTMLNPITQKTCERRFSFRIPMLLQAMQLYGDDNYDDGFDDEDRDNVE